MDRFWPAVQRFRQTNHTRRGEIRVAKLALNAEGYEQKYWDALRRLVVRANHAIRQRVDRHMHDKYRPLLGPDWRRKLGKIVYLDDEPVLANYTGPLYMAPHIDNVRVAINCFVYLDDPDMPTAEPRRGTTLYRSLGFSWPTNIDIPVKLQTMFLRAEEEIGWRDNRLLAYINGPWSFHGVEKHDLGDSRRRLLMFGSIIDKSTAARVFDPELR